MIVRRWAMFRAMMKTAAFITSALLTLSGISGADITFYKVFEGGQSANPGSVVEVPDGGYALIGSSMVWFFVRTDSVGNVLAQHCDVHGHRMCLNSAGELVIAEYGVDSILVYWTDQMGVVNRSKSYCTIEYDGASPEGIIETMDGGYAVCGQLYPGYQGFTGFLLRIDDQENLQWSVLFDSQYPYCFAETPDSGFVIGGSDESGDGSLTWVDADGNEEQTLLFGDVPIRSIAQTSAGYVISSGIGGVAGIDYAGNDQWSYTSGMIDAYSDACLADNGDVVAVGANFGGYAGGITRLNPDDGTLVWERYYTGCMPGLITAAEDGGFAVAGTCPASPYYDIVLIKTDSEGLCPEMGIEEGEDPEVHALLPFFPNPSSAPIVRFSIPEPAVIELIVFDITGRLVSEIQEVEYSSGCYAILLDYLTPGIYFCRMVSDDFKATQRFVVIE